MRKLNYVLAGALIGSIIMHARHGGFKITSNK